MIHQIEQLCEEDPDFLKQDPRELMAQIKGLLQTDPDPRTVPENKNVTLQKFLENVASMNKHRGDEESLFSRNHKRKSRRKWCCGNCGPKLVQEDEEDPLFLTDNDYTRGVAQYTEEIP